MDRDLAAPDSTAGRRAADWMRDKGALVVLVTIALGALAFAAITDRVLAGDAHAFDERVLLALRVPGDPSDPLGPAWFEEAVRDLTALGGLALTAFFIALVAGAQVIAGRPRAAVFLVAVVGTAIGITFALKAGFDRPRPDLVAPEARVMTKSFPSGHAATAAMAWLTLGALVARSASRRRLRAYVLSAAVVLSLAVGASRVYLGVHWPTDVAAGWLLGACCALVAWFLEGAFVRRGWIEPAVATGRRPGVGPGREARSHR